MLSASLAAVTLAPALLGQTTLTLKRVRTMPFRIVAAAGSPTGNLAAMSGEDGSVHLVDAATGAVKRSLKGHPQPCYGVAFSPDGKLVATGDDSGRIWIWNSATGAKIREFLREKGHQRGVQSLTFSPDGRRVMSVGKDDVLMIWNTTGGHPVQKIPSGGANFYGGRILRSGAIFAGTLAEGARLYGAGQSSPAATLRRPQGAGSNDIAVNREETRAYTAGRDGRVAIWDLKTRASVTSVQAHDDWVIYCALAPSGRVLATSSNDRSIRFWNTTNGAKIAQLDEMSPVGSPLTWTGSGRYVIGADAADQAVIYDVSPIQAAAPAAKAPVKRTVKRKR